MDKKLSCQCPRIQQMEMQLFIRQGEDEKWFDYWKEQSINWFVKHGIAKEKLVHCAKASVDIEYEFPFGFGEIEGIHNRTDFYLKRHTEYSGMKLEYFDDQTKERFTLFVIETSANTSRNFIAFLLNSNEEEEVVKENSGGTKSSEIRTVLHLHPSFAPIKDAVFPFVNRD